MEKFYSQRYGENVQVRTMPSPYLPPAMRTLKADQIGPSSHKNEYSGDVLLGNWVEDRMCSKLQFVNVPLDGTTTYKSTYKYPRQTPLQKATACVRMPVDRSLLFSHGRELDRAQWETSYAATMGTSQEGARDGFVERTRAKFARTWDAAHPSERYMTSKNIGIDKTAEHIHTNPDEHLVRNHVTQKWGGAVKELDQTQRNLGLRR